MLGKLRKVLNNLHMMAKNNFKKGQRKLGKVLNKLNKMSKTQQKMQRNTLRKKPNKPPRKQLS